ncbi:MAG: 2-dehydropantoate 2-reductase [Burkholderiales bacterium]|nr:2-dehydropantoate 2-reductase [Burkholderiales bacterium]
MRIAVIGAGGVGGYFGAQLARAGADVAFVARGRQLAALLERGLVVESEAGPVALPRVDATDDPAAVGPVDAALLCVKMWDVEATAPRLAPLVERGGVVIPFQNGVDAPAMLRAALPADAVAGGTAQIAATIRAPGVIAHTGTLARLRVGTFADTRAAPVDAFVAASRAAGIDCARVNDVEAALWEKFSFLASFAGLTAAARVPIGRIRADPAMRATLHAALREVVTLGRTRGGVLAADLAQRQLAFCDTLPDGMRSSQLNDLLAGGRIEAPWLSGAVVRMGEADGVPTPVHATLYAVLRPYVDGRPA